MAISTHDIFIPRIGELQRLPLFSSWVSCGFPNPADDHIERELDLNELIIRDQLVTRFVRAQGNSMIGAGIQHGDYLSVDQGLQTRNGDIVLAAVGGRFTVKRIQFGADGRVALLPENPLYKPIILEEGGEELSVFGPVTWSMRRHRK